MSMLAERKRKQRWSLNPRGKFWAEDTNGFGQKMLEKMGWKHGKGLGANEDGMTESLKVAYKNDLNGMGYKENEQWTAHDDNFSKLLKNLNGSVKQPLDNAQVSSLESKSQKSRARIHYHKFTKGKDLSKYSEKDIASILGRKSLREELTNNEISKEIENSDDKSANEEMLLNRGSMADYFKKKLSNFDKRSSNYTVGSNGVLTKEISDSENERVGFGFTRNDNDNGDNKSDLKECRRKKRRYTEIFSSYTDKYSEETEEPKEKKKPRNGLKESFVSYLSENNGKTNTHRESIKTNSNETVRFTKGSENDNLEISFISNTDEHKAQKEEKDKFQCIIKEKKKKKKDKMQLNCSNNEFSNEENHEHDEIDRDSGELKSRKSNKTGLNDLRSDSKQVNEEQFLKQHEESAMESKIEDDSSELKKKKSKKDRLKNYIIEESLTMVSDKTIKYHNGIEIQNNDGIEICDNFEKNGETEGRKKQKKSKKKKSEYDDANGILNPAFNDFTDGTLYDSNRIREENEEGITEQVNGRNCEETLIKELENTRQKQKKHKKRDEGNIGILNPAFNDFNDSLPNESLSLQEVLDEDEKSAPKKKKKKRKREDISNEGIDNPTFGISVSDCDISIISATSSNSYEIKSKEKKKKKIANEEIGLDNPALNLNDKTDDIDPNKYDDSISSGTSPNPCKLKNRKKKIRNGEIGLDNPGLNLSHSISDTDLVLNVVSTPVILKKNVEKFDLNSSKEKVKGVKRKSVRFSDVLQERIIPNDPSERINEYISKRNELFDINTMVIEESLKEEMKKQGIEYHAEFSSAEANGSDANDLRDINKKVVESSVKEELKRGGNSCGFVNNGFDIRSVDKVNFFENKYEIKSSKNNGIDNRGFNKLKNQIEENVEVISNTIERYQAEIENDINESKVNRNRQSNTNANVELPSNSKIETCEWMVGDVGTQIDRNVKVEEGLKLCFKNMHFKTPVPSYLRRNINSAKKTYRHLIRGDITVAFKNSNLHEITGYAINPKEKLNVS